MQFTEIENDEGLIVNHSWDPDEDTVEGGWDDEDDEDFDDRAQDLDDLHEIQVDDDLGEPDAEDEDHFPDEDED